MRPEPANKLTKLERQLILETCNEPRFASLPPSQIVPKLVDEGTYIASESSFYRVLSEAEQLNHRGRIKPKRTHKEPETFTATGPNQVWSWDITYLASSTKGQYYYLYLVEDIFSRKGVVWEVHEVESGDLAAEMIQRGVIKEKCFRDQLVLHSDNGSPMKSQTMLAKLYEMGITPSRSRPRVSNDNPFSESLFKTLKYCAKWPAEGFKSLEDARTWVEEFMTWYNNEHQHSQIKFVTPAQRHAGIDVDMLKKRNEVYEAARKEHPNRWSGKTRNWEHIKEVTLNPGRKVRVEQMTS